jgi:sulfite exporter TauE/SafE
METGYILAFTTGIIGGFGHCIGMCGPLVASYTLAGSMQPGAHISRIMPHVLYNSGRITMYSLIGGVMGLSGSFINVAGRLANIQNSVAVLAGVIMVLMGASIAGRGGNTAWIEKHNTSILRAATGIRASSSSLRYFPLGIVLGLLPCGLSYTVFIAAAGTGGFSPGMLTALVFGLGTLPALLAFGAIISSLSPVLRSRIYRSSGVLVILMGIYYLYRGISLYANL